MLPARMRPRRAVAPLAATALLTLSLALALAPAAAPALAQGGSPGANPAPIHYALVDQWPENDSPLDAMGSPGGLAAAEDGSVYLADFLSNRVAVMDPDGTWNRAFGNSGNGPDRVSNPNVIEIDNARDRVYVGDYDSYRIVVFDHEGGFVREMPEIYAAGMTLAPDGLLYVADVLTSQVRAFDGEGAEVFRFGQRGSTPGMFRMISDVAVSAAGDIFVGDRRGSRIQVFRREGLELRLVRTMDLTDGRYRKAGPPPAGWPRGAPYFQQCSAWDLVSIDAETLFAFPCLIRDNEVEFLNSSQPGANVFGFFFPYVNSSAGLYYAMAIYDPEPDNPRNDVAPAIVRYRDGKFKQIESVFPMAAIGDAPFRAPQSIDVLPNGTVYVRDFSGVARFTAQGEKQNLLPVETFPTDPVSITLQAATGDGTPEGVIGYGTCKNGRSPRPNPQACLGQFTMASGSYRGEPIDYLEPVWTTTTPPAEEITAFAFDPANDLILLLNNAEQELIAYQRQARGRKLSWPLGGSDRTALYADVTAGPDGLIYVLDVLRDEIQVRDGTGDLKRVIKSPSDTWNIAGGPGGSVFALTAFGEVLRLDAWSGAETVRFSAKPSRLSQARNLVDLDVAEDGRVFVANLLVSEISVYAPMPGPPEVLKGTTCALRGDKQAGPDPVTLGEAVDLLLTIEGSCGSIEEAADILVLVNTKRADALEAARKVISLADYGRHTVGLMGYYVSTHFKVRWTQDGAKIAAGLETLNAGGGTESSELNALREAQKELAIRGGANRKVVVLIGAEYCVKGELTTCEEQQSAEAVAEALRAAGVRVVVVNGTSDAGLLASSDLDVLNLWDDALFTAVPIYQRMTNLLHPPALLKQATVTDRIPPTFDLVPGSIQPASGVWDPATRTITWQLADAAYTGTELRYRLRPNTLGRQATNLEAYADYVDGWDGAGRLSFPVPEVLVVPPPSPTPTETPPPSPTPSATLTSPPSATATATPEPRALFLPIAHAWRCVEAERPVDLLLVIDISSSMGAPTEPGGRPKIDAAREAAGDFLGRLAEGDRAAVVVFDAEARLLSPLGADPAAAGAALAGLATGSGSRLEAGIAAAREILEREARPESTRAMVLLTDAERMDAAAVLAEAEAARAQDIRIYAIGLGMQVDDTLLATVAGDPARYLKAPSTEDLGRAYEDLVVRTSCP